MIDEDYEPYVEQFAGQEIEWDKDTLIDWLCALNNKYFYSNTKEVSLDGEVQYASSVIEKVIDYLEN